MRDSSAADHPGSKANAEIRIAKEVRDRTKTEGGTVLVSADRDAVGWMEVQHLFGHQDEAPSVGGSVI